MGSEDFRQMEYKMLREWIVENVVHRRRLQEICILSVAAFYAFLFTHVASLGPELFRVSLLVPGLIVALAVFRWAGILATISNHGDRMVEIEIAIAPDGFGLEGFMRELRERRLLKGPLELYSEAFTWAFLGFLCLMTYIKFKDSYQVLATLVENMP